MYADKRYRIKAEERDRERERETQQCMFAQRLVFIFRYRKKGEFFLVLLLAVDSVSATYM